MNKIIDLYPYFEKSEKELRRLKFFPKNPRVQIITLLKYSPRQSGKSYYELKKFLEKMEEFNKCKKEK